MINSKKEYIDFLNRDAIANYRTSIRPKLFGDYIWKYIISLRRRQYYYSLMKTKKFVGTILCKANDIRFKQLGIKLGFTILTLEIGKGLGLPHYGTIVINSNTIIGENCRIHQGVTIGSTSGSKKSATLGDNIFLGSNSSIIGEVFIADNVAIGAGAVVVKSIFEENTTWGGVPAKYISGNGSVSNMPPLLFRNIE